MADEFDWLIEKAQLVAQGVVASGDIEAVKEFNDFLQSFAERQRAKILALMRSEGN